MEIYPGADLIECEINGRPLWLPLLREGSKAVLLDCGTRMHAAGEIPAELGRLGVEDLTWLIVTHPDGDHCGGTLEMARRFPAMNLACGDADLALVESPDHLFRFRYDAYRQDHNIYFDSSTAQQIKNCFSGFQAMSLTFVGGETFRLGPDRLLEIWHLPGHSHGHLGVYDRKYRALYYGDAIQGAGYRARDGQWALCPTYLYVNAYLQTIRTIEASDARMIVGCHWPACLDQESIRGFCAESRDFVMQTDRLVCNYLCSQKSGVTLRELCEQLSGKLGEWPESTRLELANALSGHLDRGVELGKFAIDCSSPPFVYRSNHCA